MSGAYGNCERESLAPTTIYNDVIKYSDIVNAACSYLEKNKYNII